MCIRDRSTSYGFWTSNIKYLYAELLNGFLGFWIFEIGRLLRLHIYVKRLKISFFSWLKLHFVKWFGIAGYYSPFLPYFSCTFMYAYASFHPLKYINQEVFWSCAFFPMVMVRMIFKKFSSQLYELIFSWFLSFVTIASTIMNWIRH